jgi:predicted ester cyclase
MGIAPTGREVRLTAIEIFRLANGKIAEQWVQVDNLGMLQQLGALPPPAPAQG